MAEVEVVAEVDDRLGESPVWDAIAGVLWWVDIKGARLHRLEPGAGDVATWDLEETPGAVAPRAGGGLVLAVRSGLALFDPVSARLEVVARPEPDRPGNRFNDGGCDPSGRFWAGSMDDGEKERTGALYRFEAHGSWERVLDGLGIPNTIAWSPEGTTFYFAETFDRVIHAYDFDAESGSIGNRRVFATIDPPGFPDGSAVDAEGFLWNAEWNGGRIVKYRPDGSVERVVAMPVGRPTSCAFGGPGLGTLFVTTARRSSEKGRTPGGSLLALHPPVPGLARVPFAG